MKRQIILDEYDFNKGNLIVIFSFGDDKYIQDIIDENSFEEYIQKSGKLEFFKDCWDEHSKSHYTQECFIDYDEWKKDECETDDIKDFLYYYYKKHQIPKYLDE